MWSARTSDDRGLTLVEVMLSIFLLSIIVAAVSTFLITSVKVNQSIEAQSDTATWGHEALSEIRWRLSASRMLVDREMGAAYVPLLDLSGAPAPVAARLPHIETSATLHVPAEESQAEAPDFPSASVGNSILFVETLPPFTDDTTGRRIDLYRFVYYYVGRRAQPGIGKIPDIYDLVRFESVPYADFTQMDALDEDAASAMGSSLGGVGVQWAWDPDAPVHAAFSRINAFGLVRPPDASHAIEAATVTSAVPGIGVTQQTSGLMSISVAHNQGLDFPIGTTVPRFATAADDGFPGGFEVLIAGPTRGRRVLMRLVLAASAGNQLHSRESMLVVAVSD